MSIARLSVRNPVPVNLLMLAILVIGSVSLMRLPRELMSDISFNWVFITKVYPGVSAEEVEKLITVPIEDEIRDVKGIESIASQSGEGVAFISVKFDQMSDEEFRARYQDLRAEVDKVQDLPKDALETQVQAFGSADFAPLITVHLYGPIGEKTLIEYAKNLRDELLTVDSVAKVELVGSRDREVWVEADAARLRGYGLSPEHLRLAIQAHGVNVPAGRLDIGRKEMIVRSVGEFETPAEIEDVVVFAQPDGRAIRVKDVGRVTDGFEDEQTRSRLDTEPVVSLTITKQSAGNSIAITDQVKRVSEDFARRQGGALKVTFTQDSSEMIVDILSKLTNNAWLGFVIVVVVLMGMLGLRNAILAALGIPVSFLACFAIMHYAGESFNGNSLFGLVLVLGIIVDDAIIVVENCYRHVQEGKSWQQAAIDGTNEVTLPVLSATATTVAAFLPLVLLPGIIGKFMRIIPITVTLALLASLMEAFVILPSHFADWPGRRVVKPKEGDAMTWFQDRYARVLRGVVRRRWLYVPAMLVAVPVGIGLVGLVGVDMFAGEDVNTFQVRFRMPTGTSLETTSETLKQLEKEARSLPKGEVRAVHATAGLLMTDSDWIYRSDVGQLWLDLPLSYGRERAADTIMNDLRARIQNVAGPVTVELAKLNTGPPVGKPVEVKVKGKYIEPLEQVAGELRAFLGTIDGVREVGQDFRPGTEEIRVRIDPERASLHGLTVGQVGMTLRAAVDGVEAGRMYDGDEDIDIIVRLDQSLYRQPKDVLRTPLALPSGGSIELGDVATMSAEPSYAEIRRFRNQRAITVYADIEQDKVDILEVNDKLAKHFESIAPKYPGVSLDFGGEYQEFKEAFTNVAQLFMIGVLLIYVILGAQFRSYLQPVVVLFTVPFAFVGAVIGLLVSGNPFSIATMFGMVALAGVAVNDGIVLISFANDAKARGVPPEEAVIEAGRLRLRPVILTSATTIAGLLPMAMGMGGMSLTWGPLANSIVWGLWVATVLTLFFIPALYVLIVHDIGDRLRRLFGVIEA